MEYKAYAKINLGLKVKGCDERGYHLLDMLMLPISLTDDLNIEILEEDKVEVTLLNDGYLPKDNSIYKACILMKEKYQLKEGLKVEIKKNIPMQAGLGGGTADAAFTILAINKLFNLNADMKDLEEIGVKIGSDVVYQLHSCLARVEGFGEKITKINKKFNYPILIVKPKKGIKTSECFKLYKEEEDLIEDNCIDLLIENLNEELYIARKYAKNSLLRPAIKLVPLLRQILKVLADNKITLIQMSGSGSTIYAIDKNRAKLEKVANLIKDKYAFVGVYETLSEIKE